MYQPEPVYAGDAEDVEHYEGLIAEASVKIRNRFILKVYLVLTVQLAITAGFIAMFLEVPEIRLWVMVKYGACISPFCL